MGINKYSLQYLKAWLDKFKTALLRKQLDRKRSTVALCTSESSSESSPIDTHNTTETQEHEIEEETSHSTIMGNASEAKDSGEVVESTQTSIDQVCSNRPATKGAQHKSAAELKATWLGWGRKVKENRKWFAKDKPPRWFYRKCTFKPRNPHI